MKILDEWAKKTSYLDVVMPLMVLGVVGMLVSTIVVVTTINQWEATRRAQIAAKACGYTVVRGSKCRQVKCSEPGCNETTVAYICATGGE